MPDLIPATKVYPLAPGCARESKNDKGEVTQRIVTGYISTEDVDMDRDVVLASGCDDETYFATTRSVNLDHRPTSVVGTNINLSARPGKGLYAATYVGKGALAEDVWRMIQEQIIRGFSIEWDPRTLHSRDPSQAEMQRWPGCKRLFERWTLLGYAFTARPANPNCIIDGVKSRAYLDEMEPVWAKMDGLVTSGAIHRSSAVAAGMPDRRVYAVGPPKARTAVVAGGMVWTKAG